MIKVESRCCNIQVHFHHPRSEPLPLSIFLLLYPLVSHVGLKAWIEVKRFRIHRSEFLFFRTLLIGEFLLAETFYGSKFRQSHLYRIKGPWYDQHTSALPVKLHFFNILRTQLLFFNFPLALTHQWRVRSELTNQQVRLA